MLRQFYLARGSFSRGLPMFVWVDIVLWGFISRYLNTVAAARVDFVPTLLAGGAVSWPALAWGTGLAVEYVVGACWIFARVYRYAVRTGLIARYSAESVT